MKTSRVTAEEFTRLVREGLPSCETMDFEIASIEHGRIVVRMPTGPRDLRPGDTVAGPVLFSLADLAMYGAVISAVGPVALAVTTDATMHFLRRPAAGMLLARARLLKHGKRLLVGEVEIAREGEEHAPVAHAVMTYAVP
jgi:uncharacterized protein (TIGR00369 family)